MSDTVHELRDEIADLRAAIAQEEQSRAVQVSEQEDVLRVERLQRERDALTQQLNAMRAANENITAESATEARRIVDTRAVDPATGVYLDQHLVAGSKPVEELSADELRERARAAGVSAGGSKAEIAQRLRDAGQAAVLVPTPEAAAAAEHKE